MSVDVSIIIPSYNKYPLNLFTLYSLERQTFSSSRIEVIFIDDGSNDQTYKLKVTYKPPYSFQYVRLNQNQGRAKARNIGIKMARGNILIFLDAEIMVHPNFIKHHFEMHQKEDNLVFSGVLGKFYKTYTVLFPDFSVEAFKEFHYLVKLQPMFMKKWKIGSQNKFSEKINRIKLKNKPISLFQRKELNQRLYRRLSFPFPFLGNLLFENYGENLEGFYFKWIAFLTGNVSVPKSLINLTGAFDEDFKGYGFEDWELGYRLHEKGAHFKIDTDIPCYHQEHPVVELDRDKEHRRNFLLFYQKHPSADLGITALNEMYQFSFIEINNIFINYVDLYKLYPDQFLLFKNAFKQLINQAVQQYADGREREGLAQITNFVDEALKKDLENEIERLKELNRFNHLINLISG